MQRSVILSQEEYDDIPGRIAALLADMAFHGPCKFTVVDGESGKPIGPTERDLKHWFIGAMRGWDRDMEDSGR